MQFSQLSEKATVVWMRKLKHRKAKNLNKGTQLVRESEYSTSQILVLCSMFDKAKERTVRTEENSTLYR